MFRNALQTETCQSPDGGTEYDAGTVRDVRSVTKSVVALLVGIAGGLKRVDRALSYFPDGAGLRS
jgi:hypothetical protein